MRIFVFHSNAQQKISAMEETVNKQVKKKKKAVGISQLSLLAPPNGNDDPVEEMKATRESTTCTSVC